MYLTKWPLSVYTYKFFICTQYIYEDYIITMNEMQCLITVLCCPLYMSVLQVMWCVLCFRAWTQYWVVIHHYTTRSSIQGGSIRNLLLTLSQYFSSLYFANCDANRMPCQCAGKPVGWCKWVLPGVPFGFFGFLCLMCGDHPVLALCFLFSKHAPASHMGEKQFGHDFVFWFIVKQFSKLIQWFPTRYASVPRCAIVDWTSLVFY